MKALARLKKGSVCFLYMLIATSILVLGCSQHEAELLELDGLRDKIEFSLDPSTKTVHPGESIDMVFALVNQTERTVTFCLVHVFINTVTYFLGSQGAMTRVIGTGFIGEFPQKGRQVLTGESPAEGLRHRLIARLESQQPEGFCGVPRGE